MATQAKNQEGQQVSPLIIVVAIVVLLVMMVAMGHHYLAPAPKYGFTQSEFPAWVLQDAKQSQGDISKLPPTEQQKLQTQFKGGGYQALHAAYDALQ